MTITTQTKNHILEALFLDYSEKKKSYPDYNAAMHSRQMGIDTSTYSTFQKSGATGKSFSDGRWIRLAMRLNLALDGHPWKVAKTKTYKTITSKLSVCKENALGGIFCDDSSLGKTFAGLSFARSYINVAFVDCSRVKSWSQLIKKIAHGFGVSSSGTIYKIEDRVIDNIFSMDKPLIILDEAGDLSDATILRLKGLWNAVEGVCGWYMMGANGLRIKMERKVEWNKVGYEEIFNRFGGNYQSITEGYNEKNKNNLKDKQIKEMAMAQNPALKKEPDLLKEVVRNCDHNARRLRVELLKLGLKR